MLLVVRDAVHQVQAVALQGGQQQGDLLGRVLEVVVHRDDHLEPRLPDAGDQGVVLAVVARQVDRADALDAAGQLQGRLPGVVRAPVHHEDHLVGDRQAAKDVRQPGHQRREGPRGAVTRNDHRH
ncbi:hypothetical protein GCM10017673_06360 [Streptosporangium violaceochromogenes]|nr:hypothetical protein GCM10017673_06360 [Streptosporangium violaceochromogenes]